MHTCKHAYVHTCIRAYVHTCMRACVHACMRACVHACMRACVHACIRAYVHTCIRAYVHTCIRAYVHTCIHAAVHQWTTLITALDQLSSVNDLVTGLDSKLVSTMGMDLYKRALKLKYLDPQYKDKWVLSPSAFHTVLGALRCLGKTVEGSGIDEAWQEADLYGSITVTQIINRNHHNRAVQAHQVTLLGRRLWSILVRTVLSKTTPCHPSKAPQMAPVQTT